MASSSSTFSTARLRAAPAVAGQARLVRSAQKDELYLGALRSGAGAVLGALAGAKIWLEWQKEIELLADTAYFMLTTLSGYQTLGEEYVNIIQVDPSGERVPSMFRRIALISLHAIIPYLLDKGLVYLEHELQTDTDATRTLENRALQERRSRTVLWSWLQKRLYWLTQWQRKILWQGVFVLKQSIPLLRRLHLAVFYMNGVFYNFSKRMAGIRYLSYAGSDADNQNIQSSYRILGIISLLHLMLMVSLQVYSFKQRHRARQEWKLHRNLSHHQPQQEKALHRSSRCILCLEERRHATATPCGHLFCWECVTEWCNTKAECPLCREKFQPQKLIYLRYYR